MRVNVNSPKIDVLGGGINGITTALFFQLGGAQTTLLTEQRPDRFVPNAAASNFASLFPAASIIPHSVSSPLINQLTKDSQHFFGRLAKEGLGSVWTQPHFEVFEKPPLIVPSYVHAMDRFKKLPDNGEGEPDAPRRPGAKEIYGWHFHTAFAQIPTYLPWLYRLYEAAGGEIVIGHRTANEFLNRGGDALISCTGLQGDMFGDDTEKPRIIRGHLIKVHVDQYPTQPLSYNYHPDKKIYQDARGNAADVYCYPRKEGGWALGGSRQEGEMKEGKWIGDDTVGSTIRISDIDVPEAIWTLNRELIMGLMNIDIAQYNRDASVGVRPVRTGKTSLRLEQSPLYPKLFHSGGHGGSGVTLSWGCAVELGNLLHKHLRIALPEHRPFSGDSEHVKALNVLQSLVAEYALR